MSGTSTASQIAPDTFVNRHPKWTRCILILLVFLALEVFFRMGAWCGLIPYQYFPVTVTPQFWNDIHPQTGVWHYGDASFMQMTPHGDVLYTSNQWGARDKDRALSSSADKRIVLLGDSFLEGYGIDEEKRFSSLLEERSQIEHLNFGCAGNFGSIQQWQIYEHLASRFEHSDVFIFCLPDNDFSDNRLSDFPRKRYRPYLKPVGGDFELFYPIEFEQRRTVFRNWPQIVINTIDNVSYTANFLRLANHRIKSALKGRSSHTRSVCSYDTYTEEDMDILLYSYEHIIRLAGHRQVYLFIIPAESDFAHALKGSNQLKVRKTLQTFAARFSNVSCYDLLDAFLEDARINQLDYKDYTLGWDGHWGKRGHQLVADAIYQKLDTLYQTEK